MIHTTIIQLMDQSILIENVDHDAKMFVLTHLENTKKNKKQAKRKKQFSQKKICLIVDDECLIIILYNILYTNLSLFL